LKLIPHLSLKLGLGKLPATVICILLMLASVATYLVYQPGLSGPFLFDDMPNIVDNAAIAIGDLHANTLKQAALSSESGMLRRPISMLSFAINYYATGFNPFYFKVTNLFIHICSGLGISLLCFFLLDAYRKCFQRALSDLQIQTIGLCVASAWLLHPFNLTAVLYVVQRMTGLSAMFVIWGLVFYSWGRIRCLEGKSGIPHMLLGLFVFTPLAVLCKETGALIPAFMFIIEITLFRFQTYHLSPVYFRFLTTRRFLIGLFVLTIGLPVLTILSFLASHPSWLSSTYLGRGFTLTERVMTESRVIWFYLSQTILPSITAMGLFHDDMSISKGMLTPWTTLPAILGIVGLWLAAWLARRKFPLVSFGILFFFVGHALESSVWPLELVYEHRNYLPSFGILLPVFFYLLSPLSARSMPHARRAGAALLIALFAFDTRSRASDWSNPVDMYESEVKHHPNSSRDNTQLANIIVSISTDDPTANEASYNLAQHYFEQALVVEPNNVHALFGLFLLAAGRGKAYEPRWVDELERRLQNAPLENDIGNKMIQLVDCQIKKKCTLSRSDIERILNAPLHNALVTGNKRGLLLSALSYYLVDIAKDYPAALDVMYQTVETAPQVLEFRIGLIKFLFALQRPEEAKKQVAILKQTDSLHIYSRETAEMENHIASATK